MSPSFNSIFNVAHSGLGVQTQRLQVVAENLANSRVAGTKPGEDPYRRKIISFSNEMDRATGDRLLQSRVSEDETNSFSTEFNPGHPAADARGYVRMPNVNMFIELADLKEANRTYQANLQTIRSARELYNATVELLKG
jgi:flagellar basal-body rod protein FlgC